MGNKNTAEQKLGNKISINNKEKPEQKELGWNYRITDDYVFFMEGFLHQWYKCLMMIDDFQYNCCEQYMMIEKAKLFNDEESLKKLKKSENPLDQKVIGREIKNFNEEIWQKHRFHIVYKGNLHKFQQNKELRDKLLSYPHQIEFVNANPGDKIWGVGVGVFDPKVVDPNNWNGLNLLGEVITKVRNTLISNTHQYLTQNINKTTLNLITGYVRCYIEKKYKMDIPKEIVLLLAEFYVLYEDIRFNVFNPQNCLSENDGLICKSSDKPYSSKCHRLFVCNKGFNVGVVFWKLKFITNAFGTEGGIGIVSGFDHQVISEERPWINHTSFQDLVYWSRYSKEIDFPKIEKKMNVGANWKDGDFITVLLNCQEWYVQFYLNEELLKDSNDIHFDKIMIPKDRTYYPIIAFYEESDEYQVIVL